MRLKVIKVLVLCLTFNLALAVSGARAEGPTETVQGVVDEVIRILKDPSLKAQKKLRRDKVKQAVDSRFDYEEMAKRSLARNWRSLSAGQRREFVRIFAELLEASYSGKIMHYSGEKVQYEKAAMDGPDYAEVRTVLLRKNDRIPMNYRMILKPQGWMVYDVVIEGVSLVSNYRSQFNRVIRESSYNELLRRLRVKINELQKTENL